MTHALQMNCWTFQQAQILQQALVEMGVASSLENYSTRANDSPNVHLWVHLNTLDGLSKIKAIATQHAITTIVDRHQQTQHVFITLTNNELPAGQNITERVGFSLISALDFFASVLKLVMANTNIVIPVLQSVHPIFSQKMSPTGLLILGKTTSIIFRSIAIAIGLRVTALPSAWRALRLFHNPTTTF